MPRDMAMAFYWRVREFRIVVKTHIVTMVDGSPENVEYTADRVLTAFDGLVVKENQLVCPQVSEQWDFHDVGNTETDFFMNGASPIYDGNINGVDYYLVPFYLSNSETFESFDRGNGECGTYTISFLNYSITNPLYWWELPTIEGGTTVTITAQRYWAYDPGDGGGPIYDEATGTQLRPT